MATHIDLVDSLDDFDIDCLDIDMVDALLDDDLDEPPNRSHGGLASKGAMSACAATGPSSGPHVNGNGIGVAAQPASQLAHHQRINPLMPPQNHHRQRFGLDHKRGQQTIDSMFSKREPLPSQQSTKTNRADTSQLMKSMEPIEIDSDYGDLMDDDLLNDDDCQPGPDLPPPLPPAQPHQPYHQPRQPLQMFQARELTVKSRGDNTLVEETHAMNLDAMRTYIYPLLGGQPARAYQQGAVQRCLLQNTLVALPTGMGKTLIAVVVMANYARWFPNCLSVFLAPTKPLVAQQMQACKSMIRAILSKTHDPGQATQQIPRQANWIVEMNGSTPPKSRQALWSSARFVFSTPQILQNDLKLGTLDRDNARRITLLVIDEAHRATGKYAYGESISGLYSVFHGMGSPACDPMQPSKAAPFRVMALTATPGSNIEAVREIVQRLHVAHIFIRTEESLDVVPYMHGRRIEEVVVDLPPWLLAARDRLADVISRSINILCNVCHAMANPGDPRSISGFKIRLDRDRFLMRHQGGGDSGMDIPRILSEFTVAMSLAHIMQLLSEHGLRPAWTAINMWTTEVMRTKQRLGSASRAKVDCVDSKEWEVLFREFGSLIDTLDNKQSAVPGTGAAGFNVSTSSLVSSAHAPALSTVRTDVVSSFFGKSGQTSSLSTLAGRPQSLVELAPKGFLGHPKLERMVEIVRSHFGELGADDGSSKSTRIIIFSQYRGSVNEIVGVLDHLRPLVRCEPFIGQSKTASSSSKPSTSSSSPMGRGGSFARGSPSRGRGFFRGCGGFRGGGRGGGGFRGRSGGSSMLSGGRAGDTDSDSMDIDGESIGGIADDASGRGLTQKEQLAVLARFRQGDTNIIVATCVGEEGLDIGEVDLIINYDAPSSPIRLLQRIGRTGRARRGKVVVFLAKGTREEDSYKKAQREYKSVQAKIASGNGLMLREDLSPPMLCPSLPPGAPLRVELHLTKDDIAVADASASNSKGSKCQATASGSRVRGGGKLGASAGIDNADMGTFRSLSLKYPTSLTSASATASACNPVSCAEPVSGLERQRVERLLERGTPWQSSESPQFSVAHSERSSMYCRIMTGLESARFNEDLAINANAADSGKSLFSLPAQRLPVGGQARSRMLPAAGHPANTKKASKSARPATLASDLCGLGNCSDDELEDVGAVLAKSHTKMAADLNSRQPLPCDGSRRADAISIDSSPLLDDSGFPWPRLLEPKPGVPARGNPTFPAPATSARLPKSTPKRQAPGLAVKSPASVNTGLGGSGGGIDGQQRQPHQRNLFDAIDSLVKSGKAKRAFDWSMTLDACLVSQAKTRGLNLELSGYVCSSVGENDESGSVAGALAPARPSIFGDIGDPGTFDKLYDESLVRAVPAEQPSVAGGKLALAGHAGCHLDGMDVLCPDSDAEDIAAAAAAAAVAATADVASLGLDSLSDMEYSSPPALAIPETPPMVHASEDNCARPEPPQAVYIDDDDADGDLLAFDIDSDDILELYDNAAKPLGAAQGAAVEFGGKSAAVPSGASAALGVSVHQQASQPASSSPLNLLRSRRRARVPADSSMSSEANSTPPLPSSSPVRRQGGRLLRGKASAESSSTNRATAAATSTHSSPAPKRRKLRRAPANRDCNPFIDNEAAIGNSDDDEHGLRIGGGQWRAADVESDNEDGSEDLDQNLSSFIVEDDHIEFESPRAHGHGQPGQSSPRQSEVTPRRVGDIYRQSLFQETTPVSEIMKRLAEREKQRRWVSDTPTRGPRTASTNGLVFDSANSAQGVAMAPSDVEDDGDYSGSSDFERAEDLFTQEE